jgi:DNA-binding NarL/FixJ family response regulator
MPSPKIRVLLADDNSQLLEYVRKFVSGDSCEVVGVVGDGQAAVEAAAKSRPDVLVLDISMPRLNGIEAAKHMKELAPSIKIVFLTVDMDLDVCCAALQTGACGYVLKPRLVTDLIPAIKAARDGVRFVSPGCGYQTRFGQNGSAVRGRSSENLDTVATSKP